MVCNQEVIGSNPIGSNIIYIYIRGGIIIVAFTNKLYRSTRRRFRRKKKTLIPYNLDLTCSRVSLGRISFLLNKRKTKLMLSTPRIVRYQKYLHLCRLRSRRLYRYWMRMKFRRIHLHLYKLLKLRALPHSYYKGPHRIKKIKAIKKARHVSRLCKARIYWPHASKQFPWWLRRKFRAKWMKRRPYRSKKTLFRKLSRSYIKHVKWSSYRKKNQPKRTFIAFWRTRPVYTMKRRSKVLTKRVRQRIKKKLFNRPSQKRTWSWWYMLRLWVVSSYNLEYDENMWFTYYAISKKRRFRRMFPRMRKRSRRSKKYCQHKIFSITKGNDSVDYSTE